MSKTLDAIDRRLLALLAADARTPLVALARAIGLSRSAAQERLRRLETGGVIRGYTVRVQPAGERPVQAWLRVKYRPGFACAQVVPGVVARPEVRLCHSLAGPTDLLVLAEAGSLDELADLREHFAALPGVAEVETAPVLAVHRAPA